MAAGPMPKISVVIVSYNFAKYLRECIESILSQTLRPFEIIICDDHSTDHSWEIIKGYCQQYPNLIKGFRQDRNLGPPHNGEFGRQKAKGDLISWMDGDDRWCPRKLELEWKALQEHPEARIAYSNVYVTDAEGNRIGTWYDDGKSPSPPNGDVFIETYSRRFFPKSRSVFRHFLIYRSAYEEIGPHDESLESYWDWDVKIQLTARFLVAYSGGPLVEYRQHEGGFSKSDPAKHFRAFVKVYEKNLPLLERRSRTEVARVKCNVASLIALRQMHLPPSERLNHYSLYNVYERNRALLDKLPEQDRIALKEEIKDANPFLDDGYLRLRAGVVRLKQKGIDRYARGDLAGAEQVFRQALAQAPRDRDVLISLGRVYYDMQRYEEALECLREAVEANPEDVEAWIGIALIARHFGDSQTFTAMYQRAKMLDPTHPKLRKLAHETRWEVVPRQAHSPRTTKQSGVTRPFLVNSLPKAGTNLLAKAVGLFPGIRPAELHIGQSTHAQLRERDASQEMKVPIGVDWPRPVSLNAVQESLQKLENGHHATTYIPFSEQLASLLTTMGLKTFLILRDPRDVVVSHAKFIARRPDHFLFDLYRELPESERIMKSIIGVKPSAPGGPMLLNIRERCLSVLPWASQAFNYTTYFEKLVGSQGGGTREAQIEELENIARHLGLQLQRREVEPIADKLFGGTHTFRKGTIGNWQNYFSPEHKRVFKDLAGQLLIDLGYEQDFDW